MDIYIPTFGRASPAKQPTLQQLTMAGVSPTLVVQAREVDKYDWYDGNILILPDRIRTISATRDYLVHEIGDDPHMVMFDDDLHFAVRRADDPTKFRQPEPHDITRMVESIDKRLETFVHVGIGPREGGNRNTEPLVYNTRLMRVLAYDRGFMREQMVTFSPMELMEDFHVSLQILRMGQDTLMLNQWVSNQAGGSNAAGGCSTYRSDALQAAEAAKLAARHTGFVRVVQKDTKTAWGGRTRTDVVVYWKRARESANE